MLPCAATSGRSSAPRRDDRMCARRGGDRRARSVPPRVGVRDAPTRRSTPSRDSCRVELSRRRARRHSCARSSSGESRELGAANGPALVQRTGTARCRPAPEISRVSGADRGLSRMRKCSEPNARGGEAISHVAVAAALQDPAIRCGSCLRVVQRLAHSRGCEAPE